MSHPDIRKKDGYPLMEKREDRARSFDPSILATLMDVVE